MPKRLFYFIVIFLTVVTLFPLISCGGNNTTSEQTSTTTPQETFTPTTSYTPASSEIPSTTPTTPAVTTTTTEIVITETQSSTTTLSITSTTTGTTTTPGPSTSPANAADLIPVTVDGKSFIAADTSSKDYKEFKIKAGITNIGQSPAVSVTVNLYNTGSKIYTWNVKGVDVGENVILETTIGDILTQTTFTPGTKSLNIDISVADSSQEIGGNNKSAAEYVTIAPRLAARNASQSTVAKMIQESIDNSTWYTNANKNDLMTIAREALKGANVQWSSNQIDIKPFDDFNKLYSDTYGSSDQQKEFTKGWLEQNRLIGFGFVWGTTSGAQTCLREGTLVQLLPALFTNLGEIAYAQANYAAYYGSGKTGSLALIQELLEAYGFSILRDNYGFSGLSNMSASMGSIPNLDVDIALKRVWYVTVAADYLNGDVPSNELLKVYKTLLMKPDPATYMGEIDEQAVLIDATLVKNIILWRMVDQDAVVLAKDIINAIDPTKSNLSLDRLISYQDFVVLPW